MGFNKITAREKLYKYTIAGVLNNGGLKQNITMKNIM